MGLFGDLDIASAEENPWLIPPNSYEAFLFEVAVKDDKNGGRGLSLVYKISTGAHEGKTAQEWKGIPNPDDPANPTADEKKAASYIKQRLSSLGVPESRMNTVEVSDLVGTPVVIKVVQNGDFTNVAKVELRTEDTLTGTITASGGDTAQVFSGFGN